MDSNNSSNSNNISSNNNNSHNNNSNSGNKNNYSQNMDIIVEDVLEKLSYNIQDAFIVITKCSPDNINSLNLDGFTLELLLMLCCRIKPKKQYLTREDFDEHFKKFPEFIKYVNSFYHKILKSNDPQLLNIIEIIFRNHIESRAKCVTYFLSIFEMYQFDHFGIVEILGQIINCIQREDSYSVELVSNLFSLPYCGIIGTLDNEILPTREESNFYSIFNSIRNDNVSTFQLIYQTFYDELEMSEFWSIVCRFDSVNIAQLILSTNKFIGNGVAFNNSTSGVDVGGSAYGVFEECKLFDNYYSRNIYRDKIKRIKNLNSKDNRFLHRDIHPYLLMEIASKYFSIKILSFILLKSKYYDIIPKKSSIMGIYNNNNKLQPPKLMPVLQHFHGFYICNSYYHTFFNNIDIDNNNNIYQNNNNSGNNNQIETLEKKAIQFINKLTDASIIINVEPHNKDNIYYGELAFEPTVLALYDRKINGQAFDFELYNKYNQRGNQDHFARNYRLNTACTLVTRLIDLNQSEILLALFKNLTQHGHQLSRDQLVDENALLRRIIDGSTNSYLTLVTLNRFISIPPKYQNRDSFIFYTESHLTLGFLLDSHNNVTDTIDIKNWVHSMVNSGFFNSEQSVYESYPHIKSLANSPKPFERTFNLLEFQFLFKRYSNIQFILKKFMGIPEHSPLEQHELLLLFQTTVLKKKVSRTKESLQAELDLLEIEKKEQKEKKEKLKQQKKKKFLKQQQQNNQSKVEESNNSSNSNNSDGKSAAAAIAAMDIKSISPPTTPQKPKDNNNKKSATPNKNKNKNSNNNINNSPNQNKYKNQEKENDSVVEQLSSPIAPKINLDPVSISLSSTTTSSESVSKSSPSPNIAANNSNDNEYNIKIGKFKFNRKEENILGRGSNGTLVFKGIWNDRIPVAIKQMHKAFNPLISKEIEALVRLTDKSCSSMIRYIDQEEDEMFVYLGLTLCGKSLQDLVESNELKQFIGNGVNNKEIDSNEEIGFELRVLDLIKDIINGIGFLHSQDIVHNDLNPRNILTKDGRLVISDLGLSKMEVSTSFNYSMHGPTGQEGYHPAEVLMEKRKTKSVDIFSLGCIIYYLLTNGQHPFGNKFSRVYNIVNNNFDTSLLSNSYPLASDLISQMISKNEKDRPTIELVLKHPLFWGVGEKIKFIDAMFNLFKDSTIFNSKLNRLINLKEQAPSTNQQLSTQQSPQQQSQLLEIQFLPKPWNQLIDSTLLEHINYKQNQLMQETGKKKFIYQYDQVKDLVRCIRNTIQHHKDISRIIQNKILLPSNTPTSKDEILDILVSQSSVLNYFESRIPELFYHLYQKFKKPEFKSCENYFEEIYYFKK